MAMKPRPAMSFRGTRVRYCPARLPRITAMAVERQRAAAAATNTSAGCCRESEANKSVASCVLSPSSARNTVVKMAMRSSTMSVPVSSSGMGGRQAERLLHLRQQRVACPVVGQRIQSLTQIEDERGVAVVPVMPADNLRRQAALLGRKDHSRDQVEAVVELRQDDLAAVAA